jgi:Cytochrome P450
MTVVDDRRTYPKLPHPRWRIPFLGDVLSYDTDAPSQSAIENAMRLGPIFELKALGVRYVIAAGADVVTDLNDESRFCKHIGPEIEALRILLYKPFGTGQRSCIGRQFGLHEAVLILGALVRRYDLIADPNYELQIQDRLTLMPRGFRLGLRRR